MAQVQFDEDKEFSRKEIKNPNPKTALDSLMRMGFVRSVNQGTIVLLFIAVALVFGAYYVFKNSFPDEPALGADILKPGEVVPNNRNAR